MKYLGVADMILGIRIHRTPQGLTLSQSHYIEKGDLRAQIQRRYATCGHRRSTEATGNCKTSPAAADQAQGRDCYCRVTCGRRCSAGTRPVGTDVAQKLLEIVKHPLQPQIRRRAVSHCRVTCGHRCNASTRPVGTDVAQKLLEIAKRPLQLQIRRRDVIATVG
ncbi:hypothetical protein CQW23_24287 [Capsicum baccatum]|uniref:Uncharacterized protein n=1 Tax=Capsicum baccatum TaxID=33114 RepID=A0A2G2VUD0_CAPBA|nr:hypothetical protein CQW23_24287 [Capsicum baccatum]